MSDSRVGEIFSENMKKCFPTRIAFKTVDSKASGFILGEPGAEELLGKGDMLIRQTGIQGTKRVQAPYISHDEIQEIISNAHNPTSGTL